jgi:hypothetical protein
MKTQVRILLAVAALALLAGGVGLHRGNAALAARLAASANPSAGESAR